MGDTGWRQQRRTQNIPCVANSRRKAYADDNPVIDCGERDMAVLS